MPSKRRAKRSRSPTRNAAAKRGEDVKREATRRDDDHDSARLEPAPPENRGWEVHPDDVE